MQTLTPDIPKAAAPPHKPPGGDVPFGVNEMRLSAREWLATLAIVAAVAIFLPRYWVKLEPFPTTPDYRIPYALSKDYWLYQRRIEQDAGPDKILVLGDSVVWGEYVLPDGTLSHFLNQQPGQAQAAPRFINGGVNGLFPLAMEGLVNDYCPTIRNRKVIVEFNLLWLSSPKADLSTDKQETFNHSHLVPQFSPRIPAYDADANERLGALLEHKVAFFKWTDHLQNAYYDQRSIPLWTLADDGNNPPVYPNSWKNPLGPLKSPLPGEPAIDPERGPKSKRHKPWNASSEDGSKGVQPGQFEWVALVNSVQWEAFQRVVRTLRSRGNDVLVIVGPFNEHMIKPALRPEYELLRDTAVKQLTDDGVNVLVPRTLPSELYADASHPLTEGYALLAKMIFAHPQFTQWMKK